MTERLKQGKSPALHDAHILWFKHLDKKYQVLLYLLCFWTIKMVSI
jgi:hypothetical protein